MIAKPVITGIGIVSPAGIGTAATWKALAGGARTVERLTFEAFPGESWLAATVQGFVPPEGMEKADRVCQFAVAAAEEAVAAAGLSGGVVGDLPPDRVAVCLGTSKGGILTLAEAFRAIACRREKALFRAPCGRTVIRSGDGELDMPALPDIPPDAPARAIAARFNTQGPAVSPVAACATGTWAVIQAARLVAEGRADRVLCGGSDASLGPLWLAAFARMGVLAAPHAQRGPAWACRPFDATREGFVPGEGAAVLVVESPAVARRRKAPAVAAITGWACTTDPSGLASATPDGASIKYAMELACRRARISPAELSAVHTHGTGTKANDAAEAAAIAALLGPATAEVPVTSIKGSIGHLLGAAGAVETAIAAIGLSRGWQPGISTLIEPDPSLPALRLPAETVATGGGAVLKISSGFGGHVAVLVLGRI